jgi:hypothetical protein
VARRWHLSSIIALAGKKINKKPKCHFPAAAYQTTHGGGSGKMGCPGKAVAIQLPKIPTLLLGP